MKSTFSLGLVALALLCACQPANQDQSKATAAASSQASHTVSQVDLQAAQAAHAQIGMASTAASSDATPKTYDQPRAIDWAQIDSGIQPVDADSFNYAFALDSIPVKSYMDAYHVDAKTARYNLTVGMAVNEVLSKVLDQVGTSYVSHELTAGKDSQFIIHTTAQIVPSEYRYVFAEPFAKGLSITVNVMSDGKK